MWTGNARRRRGHLLATALVLALVGCAEVTVEVERSPDLTPVLKDYEAPRDHDNYAEIEMEGIAEAAEGDAKRSVADPVEVSIPAIGVHERLIDLGLNADGSMQVPQGVEVDLPGWYKLGPKPGDDGDAVIVGHVDNHEGPSVFHLLPHLKPGHEIRVKDARGGTRTFVVESVEEYDKDELPIREVFLGTTVPRLRLITCGGEFTASGYDSNVVVYAMLVDSGS